MNSKEYEQVRSKIAKEYNERIRALEKKLKTVTTHDQSMIEQLASVKEENKHLKEANEQLVKQLKELTGKSDEEIAELLDAKIKEVKAADSLVTLASLLKSNIFLP